MFQSSLRTAQGASMPRPHFTEEKGGGFLPHLNCWIWGWAPCGALGHLQAPAPAPGCWPRPGQGWAEEAWDPLLGSPKDPPQTCSLPGVLLPPSAQDPTGGLECPSPAPAVLSPNRRAQTAPPTPCLLQNRTGIPAGHSQCFLYPLPWPLPKAGPGTG